MFETLFCPCPVEGATEVYIPKAKPLNPNIIKDFRQISLLNVEAGKPHNNQQQADQLLHSKRLHGKDSRLLGTLVNGVERA